MLRAIALAAALVALAPGVARGSSAWSWPVRGRVVGSFSLSAAAPFAAGRHRGIAIAAPRGAPVRPACAGRVVFSGSVGRAGGTLSVRCGRLRATYQGLGSLLARAGDEVSPSAAIATVGPAGVLRLGARRGIGAGPLRRPGTPAPRRSRRPSGARAGAAGTELAHPPAAPRASARRA